MQTNNYKNSLFMHNLNFQMQSEKSEKQILDSLDFSKRTEYLSSDETSV